MPVLSKAKNAVYWVLNPVLKPLRKERVVMFHHGRCGSTVVARMLNEHPSIYWAHEIFNSKVLQNQVLNGTSGYKEILSGVEYKSGWHVYGFEMKYRHFKTLSINPNEFLESLKSLNYTHFIHLSRRNHLRQILSRRIGSATGTYHVGINKQATSQMIHLDTTDLIDSLQNEERHAQEIDVLLDSMNPLRLYYEDHILHDPGAAYRMIVNHINLREKHIKPKLQRVNPFPLNTIVSNYAEIRKTIGSSEYAWMLEE